MEIELPPDCRVETVITNHDWMASEAFAHAGEDDGVVIATSAAETLRSRSTA
jgi:hypothetical protein